MKRILTTLTMSLLAIGFSFGQNTVDLSADATWVGYMNVFNFSGGYEFGSAWGLSDVKSTADTSANQLTLQPNFNTYADNPGDVFWQDTVNMTGNKDMDAATYVEPGATFNGSDLTFEGNVTSYTLDTTLYTVSYFIKALDPNNGYADALAGAKIFPLPTSGNFSVTATAAELTTGLVIQYGFIVRGRNANPANEATLGSVVIGVPVQTSTNITTVPEVKAVTVYPNPASAQLNINSEKEISAYRIVNITGQLVRTGNYQANTIDISQLESGRYFIEFILSDGVEVASFIKL